MNVNMRFVSSSIFPALSILLSSCMTLPPETVVGKGNRVEETRAFSRIRKPSNTAQTSGIVNLMMEESKEYLISSERVEYKIPSFPWPPPLASTTEVISPKFFEKKSKTRLRDIDKRITEALKKNGYYESSYYSIPEGFALATRIEQIEEDGSLKEDLERWSLESIPVDFSLANYLRALFLATPGYYRVIVFVVTPYHLAQSPLETTTEEARTWFSRGYNLLPASIGNRRFSKNYACTALIYEFERDTESEKPRFRQPSRIPGHTHLVKAGIWDSLKQ